MTDRLIVILAVAALVVAIACLSILWAQPFDSSGSFFLLWLGVLFGECGLLLHKRKRITRWMEILIARLGLTDYFPLRDITKERLGFTRDDNLLRMQVLSGCTILAVVGLLASTQMLLLAQWATGQLRQIFLFADVIWQAIALGWVILGQLGVAAAICTIAFGSKAVRQTGGRDVYAAALRDWLWGLTAGLLAVASLFWLGGDLVVLLYAIAGGLFFAAIVIMPRADVPARPRRTMLPFGEPVGRVRFWIGLLYGSLLLLFMFQLRLFSDILGVSLYRRMLWLSLSLGLLTWFVQRVDKKSHPPGRRQVAGCCIGVAVAVLAQTVELLLTLPHPHAATTMKFLAIATQIPLAAMASMLIAHQRKTYAVAGGSGGSYLAAAFVGMAAAVWLMILLGGQWMFGGLIIACGAGIVWAGEKGRLAASRPSYKRPWRIWAIVTAICFAGSLLRVFWILPGEYQPGRWLTLQYQTDETGKRFIQNTMLPDTASRRSKVITECVAEMFRLYKGRWLSVATSHYDLPPWAPNTESDCMQGVFMTGCSPQPPSFGSKQKPWPNVSRDTPNLFYFLAANTTSISFERFDGVFWAPLPADHPHAWRCFHQRLLERCWLMLLLERQVQQLNAYSPLMSLRMQVDGGRIRNALQIARTFDEAYSVIQKQVNRTAGAAGYRSGWAVVHVQNHSVDILLAGSHQTLCRKVKVYTDTSIEPQFVSLGQRLLHVVKQQEYGVYLVPIEKLWPGWKNDVKTLELIRPPGQQGSGKPTIDGFREWLESQHSKYAEELFQ